MRSQLWKEKIVGHPVADEVVLANAFRQISRAETFDEHVLGLIRQAYRYQTLTLSIHDNTCSHDSQARSDWMSGEGVNNGNFSSNVVTSYSSRHEELDYRLRDQDFDQNLAIYSVDNLFSCLEFV